MAVQDDFCSDSGKWIEQASVVKEAVDAELGYNGNAMMNLPPTLASGTSRHWLQRRRLMEMP